MQYCNMPVFLSYITISYFCASILYLIMTKNLGTPFKNSLNKAQLLIKKISSEKRMNIFFYSFIFMLIILFIFKPFQNCTKN